MINHQKQYQSGVALLSMLLVFAIVAVMTSTMAFNNRLEIKRSHTYLSSAQATEYALGGITFATLQLSRTPHAEDFSESIFQPPNGSLKLTISDELGKFNLNNLRSKNGQIDVVQIKILQRLLTALEIDPLLAFAIGDWVDSDSLSADNSAYNSEDIGYSNLQTKQQTAYRTANRAVSHISELLLVTGVNEQVLEKLRPYISALPLTTAVNVNSASTELLDALMPGLDSTSNRRDQRFKTLDEFLKAKLSAGLEVPASLLTTESRYFLVTSDAIFANQPALWQGLIQLADVQNTRDLSSEAALQAQVLWLEKLPFWTDSEVLRHE